MKEKGKEKSRSYDMGKRDLEYPKLAICSSHESSPIAQELKLSTANWKVVRDPIPPEGSDFFSDHFYIYLILIYFSFVIRRRQNKKCEC